MAKLYDGLSSTVARSLATSDPAVAVRLDNAAPPATGTVFVADGAGAGTWGAPPAGELPEILQAIALADPPTAAGQAPLYDGAGITWGAAGGGHASKGNPFMDAWGAADESDDEFLDGSSALSVRGWDVYNVTQGVTMSRLGNISADDVALTVDKYRSTVVNGRLMLQVRGANYDDIWITKARSVPILGSTSYTAFMQCSRPMPPLLGSDIWYCDSIRSGFGVVSSDVVSGSANPAGGSHSVFSVDWNDIFPRVSQRESGALTEWKNHAAPNSQESFSHSAMNAIRLCTDNNQRRFQTFDAFSGNCYMDMSPPGGVFVRNRVGFRVQLWETSGADVARCMFAVGYFRIRMGNVWWGQP